MYFNSFSLYPRHIIISNGEQQMIRGNSSYLNHRIICFRVKFPHYKSVNLLFHNRSALSLDLRVMKNVAFEIFCVRALVYIFYFRVILLDWLTDWPIFRAGKHLIVGRQYIYVHCGQSITACSMRLLFMYILTWPHFTVKVLTIYCIQRKYLSF